MGAEVMRIVASSLMFRNEPHGPQIDAIVSELGHGFRWERGGETESQTDARAALFAFVPLCLFGVLICLVAQFHPLEQIYAAEERYPTISRIYHACLALPAFGEAIARHDSA